MKIGKTFVSGILAGISIAIGGLVFLSVENRVIGAALFTVGLFSVCSFGFHLFTGKVCYVFQNDKEYAIQLPVIWLGNLVGTGVTAGIATLTRAGAGLAEKAAGLCEVKLSDSFVSLFFLGILCNILIYIAVEGYGKIQHETGKYLALLFGVMVFILCAECSFRFFGWQQRLLLRRVRPGKGGEENDRTHSREIKKQCDREGR